MIRHEVLYYVRIQGLLLYCDVTDLSCHDLMQLRMQDHI